MTTLAARSRRQHNQHKQLFAVIGELQAAIAKGRGQKQMHLILEKLIAYTETHFPAGEAYMRDRSRPRTTRSSTCSWC
ncbi:MAG: hemerythrin family protein [bacterium]|nr:hemerythrin family protein [bacterium]